MLPFKSVKLKKCLWAALLAAALTVSGVLPVSAKDTIVLGGTPLNSDANPVSVSNDTPETKLHNALHNLVPSFSMQINDEEAVSNIKEFLNGGGIPGIKSWSYEGIADRDKILLTWELEWFDEHAVLAAYKNPVLKASLTAKQLKLLIKCEDILKDIIKRDATDYEKQLAIHDYIVINCAYDGVLARSGSVTGEEDSFFAYGALINGKAVCSGYVEAAKLLLDMVGIENYRLDSTEHTWNLVKIDDGYYHMDITWDDPEPNIPERVLYDYFNLTDAQIVKFKFHDRLENGLYPKAVATKYNYYQYNNLMANNYDDVKRLLLDAAASKKSEITIFVVDYETGVYDWDKDLRFLHDLSSKDSMITRYSYSPPNENKPTLTVRFGY